MLRSPAFTLCAVICLGLSIGSTFAMFQVVDALLLRKLPVHEPDRLVEIARSDEVNLHSPEVWRLFSERQIVLSKVAGFGEDIYSVATPNTQPQKLAGIYVTGSYFQALGVTPVRGRALNELDDRPNASPACILSFAFWRRRFQKSDSALGQQVFVNGRACEIVGIAPQDFFGTDVGYGFDIAIPFAMQRSLRPEGTTWRTLFTSLAMFGRLRPGVSLEQANAQTEAISRPILHSAIPHDASESYRRKISTMSLIARPMAKGAASDSRYRYGNAVKLMLCLTGALFFVGCLNLANLTLARSASREREFATRYALGVTRSRLFAQLMTETLVIVATSMLLAIPLAFGGGRTLMAAVSSHTDPHYLDLRVDGASFCLLCGMTLFSVLLIGIFPALRAIREPFALQPHRADASHSFGRIGPDVLSVAIQFAFSMAMVAIALVLVKTVRDLSSADLGFDQRSVLRVDVQRLGEEPDGTRDELVAQRLQQHLAADHSIVSIGRTKPLLDASTVRISTMTASGREKQILAYVVYIDPSYLPALRIPVRSGRNFAASDDQGTNPVAILSRTAALALFNENVAGPYTFRQALGKSNPESVTVVGVAADAQYGKPNDPALNVIYRPVAQCGTACAGIGQFYIRYQGPLAVLQRETDRIADEVDSRLVLDSTPLEQESRSLIQQERLTATLATMAGSFVLILAAIGIFGGVSIGVERRIKEIGIRLALGAQKRHVYHTMLRHTSAAVLAGAILGGVFGFEVIGVVRQSFYGVSAATLTPLLTTAALLIFVALVAGAIPVERALVSDPVSTLRSE
ncbi:ABC transporter permease [Candidatus Korobacter versatilis]|nr:ABC transporter permease [Candidatus Koribacter versatilis]